MEDSEGTVTGIAVGKRAMSPPPSCLVSNTHHVRMCFVLSFDYDTKCCKWNRYSNTAVIERNSGDSLLGRIEWSSGLVNAAFLALKDVLNRKIH